MLFTDEQQKQYFTLQALQAGISRVSELGANAMWCSTGERNCAVATLFPVESTSSQASLAKTLSDPSLWAQWDKNVLYMTGNQNNAFDGTPEARRHYMLTWVTEMLVKLRAGEAIINEGSDLRVPHFQIPEAAPAPTSVAEVIEEVYSHI